MSKPNKVTTPTPELDEILFSLVPDEPNTNHPARIRKYAKQQLNTYYLNLFMECLGDTEPVFAHQNGLESIGLSEAEQDSKRARNQLRQQTLNNLKNKLGIKELKEDK